MLFIDVNCCVIVVTHPKYCEDDLALNKFTFSFAFFLLYTLLKLICENYMPENCPFFPQDFYAASVKTTAGPVISDYFHKIIHQILIENTVIAGQKAQSY